MHSPNYSVGFYFKEEVESKAVPSILSSYQYQMCARHLCLEKEHNPCFEENELSVKTLFSSSTRPQSINAP